MPEQTPKSKPPKLTAKQKKFCIEFLKDLNGTKAAIRAGYSKHTAKQIATENLAKPYLSAHITKLQKNRAKRAKITPEKVINELAYIAFSRTTDHAKWNGSSVTLRNSEELEDHQVAAVSEISQGKDGVKLKTHSKTQALTLLMKHMGLDTPQSLESEGFEFDITIRKKSGQNEKPEA